MKYFSLLIIISLCTIKIKSECVCTEAMLAAEIENDLEINGKLDCRLESTLTSVERENVYGWNSDCSFKADFDKWKNSLIKNYGLTKGLLDVNGETITSALQIKNQADMCVIIRSLVGNGSFPGISSDLLSVSKDVANLFNCPGEPGQTEICAATAGSFNDVNGWYIFLDGQSITANKEPKYKLAN